jgi:gentisate 1,2-dioxygenase
MSVVAIPPVRASLSESNISTLALLYEAAGAVNFTPGWIPRNKPVLWAEPRPQFLPAHWSYEDAKAGLDAAGRLIDVTLAERRNLIMRNPAPIAGFETSRTLVAAYQMILPGEHAPSHRHSSHALRVIIDGKGSYSIVDGEKTPMETGDVVLTPGWCWHGHGHDGDQPAYWFDGLDVPLTHLLEPMFFEEHPQKYQKVERVVQTSPYRFTREDIARRLDVASANPEGFQGPRVSLSADNAVNGSRDGAARLRNPDQTLSHDGQHHFLCGRRIGREHGRRRTLRLEPRRYVRCARLVFHRSSRPVG